MATNGSFPGGSRIEVWFYMWVVLRDFVLSILVGAVLGVCFIFLPHRSHVSNRKRRVSLDLSPFLFFPVSSSVGVATWFHRGLGTRDLAPHDLPCTGVPDLHGGHGERDELGRRLSRVRHPVVHRDHRMEDLVRFFPRKCSTRRWPMSQAASFLSRRNLAYPNASDESVE